ncbi:Translocation protein SEC63 like protein [Pitangus sulphuratus]|nr:Translocation protein SEC63 like protein [Pitangus sulphuratus]
MYVVNYNFMFINENLYTCARQEEEENIGMSQEWRDGAYCHKDKVNESQRCYMGNEEMGLKGASLSEIKKQYRALSLKYHPDKGGDEVMFMRIAKAYAADSAEVAYYCQETGITEQVLKLENLECGEYFYFCINFVSLLVTSLTDEESRKNWEEYGNPDGPQATSFGIALPAWIVDQKNSILVLFVYGLAFMVILPVVVGSWWYRSIRYSGDQILIRTTQIYTYFVYKTRNMDMKREKGGIGRIGLIMVLAGASEFDPQYNKDATSRPADNIWIPQLIREIGGINLKKNEPPLTCPYSLKARVLLLTHLARIKVPEVLEEVLQQNCSQFYLADQQFILKKSPALLQEMINVICQLIIMARSREEREFRAPSLGSLENCMKLSQMTVQGLQQFKSPLLQLPHIEEDNLRRVSNHKKYKIKSIQDLVSLKGSDRRNLLHFLEDKKYEEVMAVLGSFPYVTMDIKPQVLDDEDSNNITVGSLVTVLVTLTRQTMAEVFEKEQSICAAEEQPTEEGEVVVKEEEEEVSDKGSDSEEEETNRDSQSEKDDGSDRDSDREQDEKQNKDDEAEKQEWWWLYIADRKEQMLICMPYHVCTLKDKEEVELKFPAPGKPGNYQYTVYLRSDSYMGLDQIKPLKLEVHEAKPVPENHPQWDTAIEGDEDQEDSEGFEDSFEEEEEEEEDDG